MQKLLVLPIIFLPLFTAATIQRPFGVEEVASIQPVIEQVIEEPLTAYQKMLLDLQNWERPEGPITIALQAGHWKREEAPDEFPNLAKNTGAIAGGVHEVDLNLEIATEVKSILDEQGYQVEILPATIPPDYYADVFVSIHGDGSENTKKSGYKATESRFDLTGKGERLSAIMEEEYGKATGLRRDPNISNNMFYYYAFNWRRYEHSLHPMTVGIILETGFISNPADRAFLVNETDKSIAGIVNGITQYIQTSELADLQ